MSDTIFTEAVASAASAGRRQYARWSEALFEAYAAGPALWLWESIRDAADGAAVLASYLRLVREAVGLYLTTGAAREDPVLRLVGLRDSGDRDAAAEHDRYLYGGPKEVKAGARVRRHQRGARPGRSRRS